MDLQMVAGIGFGLLAILLLTGGIGMVADSFRYFIREEHRD